MKTIVSIVGAAAIVSCCACSHTQSTTGEIRTEATAKSELPLPAKTQAAPIAAQTDEDVRAPAGPASGEEAAHADLEAGSVAVLPEEQDEDAMAHADIAYELGEIAIGRFVLTHGVEDREPIDEADTFERGERMYAFVQAINPGEEYELQVRWTKDDTESGRPESLKVGTSTRWRTWAWRSAPSEAGEYRCIIETTSGEVVAEVPFSVRG